MARGRMINKKISNDKRVNDMPLQAQLLFTWLIPHLDCTGCFYGSAQMIKSLVVPRKNWTKNQIESWLKIMEASKNPEGIPLICRYKVGDSANSEQYLFMPGFEGEQIGLRKDKEKGDFPTFDGKITESIRQKAPLSRREVEVEEEVKEEGSLSSLSSPSLQDVKDFYQKNFGEVTEDMENELRLATIKFSPSWVIDAIQEAVKRGKTDWRYIARILENWQRFGKNTKSSKQDPDKFIQGKYGHRVQR